MKVVAVLVIFAALFAIAFGAHPTPARRCDYKCTKLDETVCANNGICYNDFPSHCQMEKYNCLFPQKAFSQVESWRCAEKSFPICSLGEL